MDKLTRYAVYVQNLYDQQKISHDDFLFLLGQVIRMGDYLPRDGSKPMTGTLQSKTIIPIADNLYACGSGWGTGRWKIIDTVKIQFVDAIFRQGSGGLYTYDGSAYWFALYSFDTAMRQCLKLINGAAEIPRAGDITVLPNKTLDIMDGVLALPDSRPPVPMAGDCRYDAATDTFEIYDGAAWHAH